MKRTFLLITFLFTGSQLLGESPTQPAWTNRKGQVLHGAFLRMEKQDVVILQNGSEVRLPLRHLSDASRTQAQTIKPAPPTTAEERTAAWHRHYTPETFSALPEARAIVDRSKCDPGLLSAAMHHASNKARASHSMPTLEYSAELAACALSHSRAMAEKNFFSHKDPHDASRATMSLRLKAHGIAGVAIAENISYIHDSGYTYLSLGEYVVSRWMKSPGHRKNLLNRRYTRLGCGAWTGSGTRWLLTQNFASAPPVAKPATPPVKEAVPTPDR
jgi:uncharacterized protein YkwD